MGGASRSMISVCKLLEDSGEFYIISTSDRNENFERLIDQARPDIFLSYNNREIDLYQRKVARQYNCKIVYGLRNCHTSLGDEKMDSHICSSEFVQKYYLGRENRISTNLPLPMIESEIIPSTYNSQNYVTMVNPTMKKGLFLLEAILEEIWEKRERLDIWFKIVESSGIRRDFKLKWFRYPIFQIMPFTTPPSEIYKDTKLTIIPSIWEEPACRVLVESMLNGIPVGYSNRGGMPEVANGGGTCINIPATIREHIRESLDMRECAKKWTDWIDYWAVDFNFESKREIIRVKDDETGEFREQWTGEYIFENEWQSFRTKKDRTLELTSAAKEVEPDKGGRRKIAVKVVDIFGNDTMTIVDVNVGEATKKGPAPSSSKGKK